MWKLGSPDEKSGIKVEKGPPVVDVELKLEI